MVDENKKNDWFIEVNFNDKDEIKDSKILKITFPNGETAYTRREYLNAMLFAIGRPEDQRKMIPQTIRRVRWYKTIVSVKAPKDIQKNELVTFPITLSLPAVEEEVIAEVKRSRFFEKKMGSGLFLPR